MKELYIAPELELLSLAPAERLANNEIELDTLLEGSNAVSADPNIDIDVAL